MEKSTVEPTIEKVLIVDDEADMLESLKGFLELEKIECDVCKNARDAIKMIREGAYNIVLTDIRMPGIDGVELLRAIKDWNPMCNVIIMTGYSNMSYVVDCFSAGACDYFTKPIHDMGVLTTAIRGAIERVTRWRKGMGFEKYIEGR